MTRLAAAIGLLVLALAVGACSTSGSAGGTGWQQTAASAAGTPASLSATVSDDYRLGPQDVVEVRIFQIDDLNRTVRVDQSGEITLPLIGALRAGGRTVSELETEIAAIYGRSYLQDPRVSVFVKEYASQRIAVTGAVVDPGMFTLTGPTSLLGAVSLAKGPNDIASYSDVALIRNVNGQRVGTFHDLDAIIGGSADDPRIVGGDIVVVQRSGFQMTMRQVLAVAPILAVISPF